MLDFRIYRAAFLPALLVGVICAFSLSDRPRVSTATLAPGAFDTLRSFGRGEPPPRNSLRELALSFPNRRAGSAGDQALAERIATFLDGELGFAVERQRREGLETVVATRTGLSGRRIVVVAHRDAAEPGSIAELSGTAALLELARVFRIACDDELERQCGRELARTLVLISTSGGSSGAGGVRNWLRRQGEAPVDAVLVLGDVASTETRRPWVTAWSNGEQQPPLGLRRTVEAALRRETGTDPGGPRASAQWIRRAFPLSPGEQAELAAAGLPAVGISASGERGPSPRAQVDERRMEDFGRATLRAITAVDQVPPPGEEGADPIAEGSGIVTLKRVLPGWAVSLLVFALMLPALLVAVDGVARVRRRRHQVMPWLAWVAAASLPFALAWLWTRLLGITVLDVPPVPINVAADPLGGRGWAGLVTSLVVLALGWLVLRPLLLRRVHGRADDGADAAGAAVGLVLAGLGLLAWLANPFAAALLLPAVHLGLLVAAPEPRLRGWRAVAAVAFALVPLVLAGVYYMSALGLSPFDLAWVVLAATAGGHVSVWTALVVAGVAGCLACALALAARRPAARPGPGGPQDIVTRGPRSYAGPGSLGGTESALRR
jgi:hypothetical protein